MIVEKVTGYSNILYLSSFKLAENRILPIFDALVLSFDSI
jgi:hypothetical protein